MQRLFSSFPTGPAGLALVAWRLCLAAELLGAVFSHSVISMPLMIAIFIVVIAVVLGSFMPVSCVVAVVLQVTVAKLSGWPTPAATVISAVQALALGVLGAGAYSVDSLLFGRRQVVIPRR